MDRDMFIHQRGEAAAAFLGTYEQLDNAIVFLEQTADQVVDGQDQAHQIVQDYTKIQSGITAGLVEDGFDSLAIVGGLGLAQKMSVRQWN